MASYNRVIMMGNLTRDPEYKQLSSGQAVCRLGIASNRQFKNKTTGLLTQEVCFVDVDVWGAQAESCSQYLQKGRLILVEGRLKLDSWDDDNGQRRSKHSIVADRVTFLSAQTQDQAQEDVSQEAGAPEVKAAKPIATSASYRTETYANDAGSNESDDTFSAGEVSLSDQKPFEDDLPF